MQPDDQEAAITQAEHRIRMAVQRDADERWKNRMADEDLITTSAIEVLRSDLNEMSAKIPEKVVCVRSRHQGSAVSTVSGSTCCGGSVGNFASRTMQNTFVASRIEGMGLVKHSRDRQYAEAKQLASMVKARLKQDDLNILDWDLTDRDQANFDKDDGFYVVQRRSHSHDSKTGSVRPSAVLDLSTAPVERGDCEGHPRT